MSEILILGVAIIIAITVVALIRGRRQQRLTTTDIATLFQTNPQLMQRSTPQTRTDPKGRITETESAYHWAPVLHDVKIRQEADII